MHVHHSQLAQVWIHLDLTAARDSDGNIFVKTNEHGQIGKCSTLDEDGIYGVKHGARVSRLVRSFR